MPLIARTTVYRRNLAREFQTGGQGYRWLDRVKKAMHDGSIAAAPVRSGDIKRGHRSFITGINQYACRAEIVNLAEHAEWVHDGTRPWIEGTFRVPRKRQAGGARGADLPGRLVFYTDGEMDRYGNVNQTGVRGQRAQPWMDRACTAVAMSNGAVPYGG